MDRVVVGRVTLSPSAFGDVEMLYRPCVDCGLYTCNFCENECLATKNIPSEEWTAGQLTPHCIRCEWKYSAYHFCRGIAWATPPRMQLGLLLLLGRLRLIDAAVN